jgi:Gal80p, C-terminal domain
LNPGKESLVFGTTVAPVSATHPADGLRHHTPGGLQGQVSPAINYTKDLIAEGYVGRVLSATMMGCAPNWGSTIERAYQADSLTAPT